MLFHKHLGFSAVKKSKIMSKRFYLTLWLFLVCGSAAVSQNCPNEAVRIKCDAAAQGVTDLKSVNWRVRFNHRSTAGQWLTLVICNTAGGLNCLVTPNPKKPHGIKVLRIETDTLVIKRTSLEASFQDMEFMCIVRQPTSLSTPSRVVPIDLSVECIWSHVDAVVNLTNHFMKILPLKTVDKIVLFDRSKANAIRIGVCHLHLGCKCNLSKSVDQRSALADRLQERQCSILFSPVRDSDEGLGMRVKVHFTDSSRRDLTLRIRLKPKEVAKTTSSLPTSTQAKKKGNIPEKMDLKISHVAVKLATEKRVGKSTEGGTDSKRGQKAEKLHRTRELVAQILRMSRELNHLVNAAGNVSSAVKAN